MRYFLVFYQYTGDNKNWLPSRKLVLYEGFPPIAKLENSLCDKSVIKDVMLTNIVEISQQDAKDTRLIPVELN